MRYAGLIKNDFSAAPGVSVSFYTQGCPHHCPGCHNPETWDYDGGQEFTYDTINEILAALTNNNIMRSLCILGGEPLCKENEFLTHLVITSVKEQLPNVKVYIWTGYTYDELKSNHSPHLENILKNTDCLIAGPYIESERDITLKMRGSRNQEIIYLDKE
jgi:anaerobic ribonucleoside-triphosphate reductase activating protein